MDLRPINSNIESHEEPLSFSPVPVLTNWVAFSGTSCSGKTTVLTRLKNSGYLIIEEPMRKWIDLQLYSGTTIEDLKENVAELRNNLFISTYQTEKMLLSLNCADTLIFFDRPSPDALSFYF